MQKARQRRKRKNPDYAYEERQRQVAYAMQLKLEVLTHYSPGELGCSCPGCPIKALPLLSIDHLYVSGKHHKDKKGRRLVGLKLYRYIRDHKFPPHYQTLCLGCNAAKSNHPACPLAGKDHTKPQ